METIVNSNIICYDGFGDNMKINVNKLDIDIIKATSFYKRLTGFMFQKKSISSGLLFEKCNAIHTFFMFQPIDIIMTDINKNILFTYEKLPPNRIIFPKKGVYYTYELPIGSIKKMNI